MASIQLETMETTNPAGVICVIPIYTVDKERGLLRVWSMLLLFSCYEYRGSTLTGHECVIFLGVNREIIWRD